MGVTDAGVGKVVEGYGRVKSGVTPRGRAEQPPGYPPAPDVDALGQNVQNVIQDSHRVLRGKGSGHAVQPKTLKRGIHDNPGNAKGGK